MYECLDCGARVMAVSYPGRCDRCNGRMGNISVRRE
jgi:DNA-directed RNA polymerase subunit RPC12/RpoP